LHPNPSDVWFFSIRLVSLLSSDSSSARYHICPRLFLRQDYRVLPSAGSLVKIPHPWESSSLSLRFCVRVAFSTPSETRDFAFRQGLPYPLICGPTFQFRGLPTISVLKSEGLPFLAARGGPKFPRARRLINASPVPRRVLSDSGHSLVFS